MGNTKAYSGIGWSRFKHNLSLKFVEMKVRAQSFDEEKEDEWLKWDEERWVSILAIFRASRRAF